MLFIQKIYKKKMSHIFPISTSGPIIFDVFIVLDTYGSKVVQLEEEEEEEDYSRINLLIKILKIYLSLDKDAIFIHSNPSVAWRHGSLRLIVPPFVLLLSHSPTDFLILCHSFYVING